MKNEFFGLKKLLTTEEFNSFYLATGIDVDGRMEMIKKAIEQIQHGIMKYISFARIIPGFEDLPTDDKMALIKGNKLKVTKYQEQEIAKMAQSSSIYI